MLSIFPIHFLSPIAYVLLRLCIGLTFLYSARLHLRHHTSFAEAFKLPILSGGFVVSWMILFEVITGVLFVLGLYTQIAALVGMVYALKFLVLKSYFPHPLHFSRLTLVFIFFVSLSLFITGPGIFAFDLPI